MKTNQKAVIAGLNIAPNTDWYAVGVTQNFKPVILAFANKRDFDGEGFGTGQARFLAKIGQTVVLEPGWVNGDGQLVAKAWALSDEKLTAATPEKKAVAETKLAKSIPHASNYEVGKTKPVSAKKTGKPLKLTVSDDRMVRLKLTEWQPGEPNQLYYGKLAGGQTDGLRGWLSRKGMLDRDFTFEVEKSAKTWVPADKAVIKLLATLQEEPAGAV